MTSPTKKAAKNAAAIPSNLPAPLPTPVFENKSGLDALFFNMLNQYDNGFHVIVAKTAFHIGPRGADGYANLQAIEPPTPLATQDLHFDKDFQRSTLQESDLAPYKPQCDVIVVADAHAPTGKPVPHFTVQLQVLPLRPNSAAKSNQEPLINKPLRISGPRSFIYQQQAWALSAPQAVLTVPLRYEYALGGACLVKADAEFAKRVPNSECLPAPLENGAIAWQVAESNPVGIGFCRQWYWQASQINSFAAPQIEYPHTPYDVDAFQRCLQNGTIAAPAGFASVGRAWLPRRSLAGTVQTHWQANEIPRLPKDFDFGYWNAAPRDQQCRHLTGGEVIRLVNLCPQNHPACHVDAQQNHVIDITLPKHACVLMAAIAANSASNPSNEAGLRIETLVIDTVHINLLEQRLELTWRLCLSCDDDITSMRLIYATKPEQLARLAELQQVAADKAAKLVTKPKAGN